MISFAILGSALVFCYAILSMLIVLAPRLGLVDHPGGRKQHRTFPAICALWVVILPLCDCVSLMIRRKRAKGSMFVADRQHLHHYLLNRGFSVSQASIVAALLHAACAAVGVLAWMIGVPEWIMFAAFVVLFVAYHINMTNVFKTMPQGVPTTALGPDAGQFTKTR